jgi:hypothetical protein
MTDQGRAGQCAEHPYVSTACWHRRCAECRRSCKFCRAQCRCSCHPAVEASPAELAAEWIDSVTRGHWQSRRDIEAWANGPGPLATHRSVGYLLARTDDVLVLVQSTVDYGEDTERMVAEAHSIPVVAITAVRALR